MEVFIDLAQTLVRAEKQQELQTHEVREVGLCDMTGLIYNKQEPGSFGNRSTDMSRSSQAVPNATSPSDVPDNAIVHPTKTFNYPMLEGIKGKTIMLQTIALKDLNDQRLNTTLLNPQSHLCKTLQSALVVVMIVDGEVVRIKHSPRTETGGLLWQDHTYKSFGERNTMSISTGAAEGSGPKAMDTPIANWVQKSFFAPIGDPFSPISTPGNAVDTDQALSNLSSKKTTKRVRAAKGNAEVTVPNCALGNNGQHQDVVLGTLVHHHNSTSAHEEQSDKQGHSRPFEPPRTSPPLLPAPSSIRTNTTPTIIRESHVVRSGRAVEDGLPKFSPCVKETRTTDQAGCKRHLTVNERMPSPRLIESTHCSTDIFEEAALQILKLALHRRAPVQMMASVGRILMNHQTSSTEFKRKPFALNDWDSAFPATGVDLVEFTEMQMLRASSPESI